ncbi:MAG: multicopper oxidase domain-containing protein [Alicyclobacillus sp.]|nr:multicopper oxidase domain-containing protein [Alicyclobacillus sp.]
MNISAQASSAVPSRRANICQRSTMVGIITGALSLVSFPLMSHPTQVIAAASTSSASAPAPAPASVQVQITDYSFAPANLTIPVHTTVIWTNDDLVIHSVTSGNGNPTGLFDRDLSPYTSFAYTFTKPGTYPYYCKYHDMTGTVVVTPTSTAKQSPVSGDAGSNGNADASESGGDTMGNSMMEMNMSRSARSPGGVYGPFGSNKDQIESLGTGSKGEPILPDGIRLLPYTMQGGFKVFHLTAEPVWWETSPGHKVEAWAYNGTVPGPEIRVNVNDKVKIIVTNRLPEGTTVHWHGLDVPFAQDGTGESQPDIPPGHTHVYTFTVRVPAGTYMYHAHPMNDMLKQDKLGLSGPFIVEPKGTPWRSLHSGYQREYTLFLNDSPQFGNDINGKIYPSVPVLKAKLGDKVLVHVINMGSMNHPLNLDGLHFQEIEQDGYPLPAPVWMDTLDTQPGTTYDIQLHANSPGKWLLASSIPDQMTSASGQLSGMAAIVDVSK